MEPNALDGITVVDLTGSVATSYCAKLFADYGATVTNLEPASGFPTRSLAPFVPAEGARPQQSAMHAYLHTNKRSVLRDTTKEALAEGADLVLDDGTAPLADAARGVRASISWFGLTGPLASAAGSDAQWFAMNGMLRNIGRVEGPPMIPTGYQAQIVGGATAFIASMTHVLARELGNRSGAVHIETSIYEASLCFTEVGMVGFYNSGAEAPRTGVNRYPPTYPLGVFPCKDGWLGVTVLTPGQWHTFCALLDMQELADVPLFQTAIGRLQGLEIIEPMMCEKLLEHSAEELFYKAQNQRVPLARVPTMEELFGVDQFLQRNAFADANLPGGGSISVPTVPFRLFGTPPKLGGPVAALGEHSEVL